ncbi:SurA N-terminal domain-containing protein [Desulfuromonas acetoxidans]|uniref:PPIC-type PPIASE domain protein n=1 Tax=Desulfuromonas acetoxidans (strain DSM 684 / 11070) TaxID=281689 RepID=Q1JZD3_DESA6|nr:SurA N-terminal domain-containing protein [Desulfuromonas acetoxidans]EAT15634.1 PPIC-type PPIASE domain protein [Desulfuromonas acetoxidans DSM 684]MBF0645739.1 SurA N-terminal domain-containing protein [Desulfuromonas acetoxidans]NVD25227.1 SurA N-terminal domain-containing protein [Desulfuromonas acetoxidans]NVE17151.1 SurA N-terminal domain-containing protein [Desulfuromonas acetoxidans]
MLKKIVFTALLFSLIIPSVWAEQLSKIAAVVNDEIITTRQLEQRLVSRGERSATDAQKRQELDNMINERLMEQRSREIGLEVSDDDIETAINDVQQQNNISREQLEQALIAQGLSMSGYREQLRGQILRYKLMGYEVKSKVDITRQEVRNYYQEHLDQYRQSPRVRLSRLTFPLGDDPTAARENATIALRKLDDGESVDEVLVNMSPRTRIEGGEMGSFVAGELSETFEQAIADLDSGDHTPLIPLGDALHILKVEERIPGSVADISTVEEQIRGELSQQKMDQKLQEWRENLRSESYVDVRL